MNLRFAVAALALSGAAVYGQVQDNSQNALLKGTYNFRHVAVQDVDANNDPAEVTATYGTITFDGNGNFTVTGTVVDNTISGGAPQPLSGTGNYAIGANGLGYVANPLYINPTDTYDLLYGAVSQGVFIGSATEAVSEGYILNDLFVAIPVSTTAPTNATFASAYQTALLDFQGGTAAAIQNALFKLSADGKGGFGAFTVTGQASNQTNKALSQNVTGATYNFSSGTATLTIPLPTGVTSANAAFTGTKTMVVSADGNFILGWTPGGYDMFVGVKSLTASGTNTATGGLYFTAGLEDSTGTGIGTDSFYGGTSNTGNSNGDSILHQHLNFPSYYSEDFGSSNKIPVNSDGSSSDTFGYSYLFGDGSNAFVAIGTGGYYSLVVGLHAATFSGSGVYLNPIGVVSAASYQPVTASIAPGELLTLVGTNLAATTQTTTGGQVFPTTLGGVQVTINGVKCPIYYVSPSQLSVIVPYAITPDTTALANVQVINSGTPSNIVQLYVTDAAPGAFSQKASGLGLASALHAATGQLITTANPAVAGEYISLYLTGLGPVTPVIADGGLGSSTNLNNSDINAAGNLAIYFNDYGPNGSSTGNQGNILYAGLAPGLAGLYQINVQVPTGVLTKGDDVNVEFLTDYSDFNQIYIPFGPGASAAVPARDVTAKSRGAAIHSRTRPAKKPRSRVAVEVRRAERP